MDAVSHPTTTDVSSPGQEETHSNVTLVVRDVHVRYRIYEHRRPRLRDFVAQGFKGRPYREIHAVKGVDLVGREGEVIGIIGPNGAGKSTLMQAVAGLLPVDEGAVYARSDPAILGVGAVLNSRFSGRRNIIIGGLALGLSHQEIMERLDEIIEFSGLRDFIDVPMKAYSSGMRARLQFSIATATTPDILLIDEALAVGDREFKQRSMERVRELRDQAGTVIVVSHNLGEIREMCSRVAWLEAGQIIREGDPDEITAAYEDGRQ